MQTHPRFDVFVDGTHDRSAPGLNKAASGLAPLLSLPAEQVTKLLEGRFRVGMAVDEQTAQSMARNLTALGARVVIAPAEAKSVAPTSRPGAMASASVSPAGAPPERPRAPTAAFGSRQGSSHDDGGISIGDVLNPNEASSQFVANPRPAAAAPVDAGSAFGDDIALGEPALSVEDLPPPPPTRPAAHAQAARPAPRPAAPSPVPPSPQAAAPAAHAASDDPFAPPPDGDEAALDLAIDAASVAPARPPVATATGQAAALTAPAETSAVTKGTQPKSKRYVPKEPMVTAKGILFAVLALALGAIPGHIYASSIDRGQVVRLQNEMQDLTVNAWKQETRKRLPQTVRQEIESVRTRATWFMMIIWATTTALLAAAAFAFLL